MKKKFLLIKINPSLLKKTNKKNNNNSSIKTFKNIFGFE